jgi:sigma-B regulation protein RsbU (phosphoserine phosphatase)
MKEKLTGIAAKLILSVIGFGILLGAVSSVVGYGQFTTVLQQQYNDTAYEIAQEARTLLNPDKFDGYATTGQTDEEYLEIQSRLDDLVDATNVTFVYVALVDPSDYQTLTYVYDSVNSSTGFSRYPLGYVEKGIADKYVDDIRKLVTDGELATVYFYYYSEESGYHTSAALPVYDSKGNIKSIIVVEKTMTRLVNARNSYVIRVVIGTIAALVLFLAIFAVYLRKAIIKPVLTVAGEAKRFADTNEPSDELLKIRQKDEIGILAQSVGKMETDIVEYTKNLTAVTAEKERISTELNVAQGIQADMLPCIFPAFPERSEFSVYAAMSPAKEVGGDFYDFFLVDEDHIALVMADVSGKGVPAALFMVIAKTLIKNRTLMGGTPSEILTHVNDQLCEGNKAELFVTVWMAIVEISSGKGVAVNAGHEHPVIKRAGEENTGFEYVKYRHSPAVATMEGLKFRQHEFELKPGDVLFVYTDGVLEATNAKEELYGEDRLLEVMNKSDGESLENLLHSVRADVDSFVGEAPQFDDITMLGFTYYGKGKKN